MDTFYIVSKRQDGTTDGSIVFIKATESASQRFDAYAAQASNNDGHSNLFRIDITVTSNASAYTVKSVSRGYLYYDSANEGYVTSSSHTTITDATPTGATNEQFAFLRTEFTPAGQHYMYSIGAGKFVTYTGNNGVALELTDEPVSTWTLSAANNSCFVIKVPGTSNTCINITNYEAKHGSKVIGTDPDVGNRMTLGKVATELDLSAAIASIKEYEVPYDRGIYKLQTYSEGYLCTKENMSLYHNGSSDDTKSLWQFYAVGINLYNIKNVHTGLYIDNTSAHNTNISMTDVETNYGTFQILSQIGTTSAIGNKLFLRINGTDECVHSNLNDGIVKTWDGNCDGNQYLFTEVKEFSHTLSVTDTGWATLCLGFNATIPADVEVYAVTGVKEGNWLALAPVTGVLPANTGVLVKAEEGTYAFSYTTESATIEDNKLSGELYNKNVSKEAYILATGENGIGLYRVVTTDGAFACKANCAYLPVDEVPTAAASNGFRFDFGDGTTTEIEKVEMRKKKEEIFDLQGRRINEITCPGIYIVNGVKKVLVKQ